MAIALTCTCSAAYQLKDEMAGATVECPRCHAHLKVPAAAAVPAAKPSLNGMHPAFQRDKFLLQQKHMSINEKYGLWDEVGNQLLFIERPSYLLQNLVAVVGGLAASVAACYILVKAFAAIDQPWGSLLAVLGFLPIFIAVAVYLAPKRDVTFYRSEEGREPLLQILQDQKWAPITATFTVRTPDGTVLGSLSKNYLYDLLRKRWRIHRPDGSLWATAKEDSMLLALLRRFLGPLFGLLRTNFVILKGETEEILGEFNRKMTLLDKYVLDMSRDPAHALDRRMAAALGVMLDTGERR